MGSCLSCQPLSSVPPIYAKCVWCSLLTLLSLTVNTKLVIKQNWDINTLILRNEFVQFLDELPYQELRQSLFTVELEVADRMFNLSERICSEFVFSLCIFESWYCDISLEIIEIIEQLLKLYEDPTERYRARLHWLEEGSKDNSFRCQRRQCKITRKATV